MCYHVSHCECNIRPGSPIPRAIGASGVVAMPKQTNKKPWTKYAQSLREKIQSFFFEL